MESDTEGILADIDSGIPGPRLGIVVATHGNEKCGVRAVERILPKLTIQKGSLLIILGNPRAYEQDMRFTQANLNRLYREESELSDTEKNSYEFQRSREIMPLLQNIDALLDIHTSGSPDTQPFIICEENALEVIKAFPVQTVTTGWTPLEPGGTDVYINEKGGIGICIECGYHPDPSAIDIAQEAMLAFLTHFEAIDPAAFSFTPRKREQTIFPVQHIHTTKVNFTPVQEFADFEEVSKGQIIGTDGDETITAPTHGFVVFVRNRQTTGEEAFLFGSLDTD